MQYENENMDELFRKAAENYPLDTSSKDWDKVFQALQTANGQTEVVQKNNKGRFLWLLILLPMGLVCNKYLMHGDNDENSISSAAKHVIGSKPSSQSKKQSNNDETSLPMSKKQTPQAAAETTTSQTLASVKQRSSDPGHKAVKPQRKISVKSTSQQLAADIRKTNQKNGDKLNKVFTDDVTADPSLLTSFIGKTTSELSHQPVPASSKLIADPNEKKNSQGKNRTRKFYLGAVAGLDLTTIKLQKIEDVGFDYGILMGYALNKKWSFETGLTFDKKIYYSDGKYFNTSNIWMPPNSKITQVEGDCHMMEIPLSVKYNFSANAKHSWFGVVGASSYLMRQEDYNSTYYYAGSGSTAVHYKQYDTHSTTMFAAIQVSGGYIHRIGKWTDLRVEPYLKLPTTGMGIGELPFTSVGLHLGITGKLF